MSEPNNAGNERSPCVDKLESSALTRDQVRQVDQLAVSKYRQVSITLMENAGRNAAEAIDRHYGPAGKAMVFCGPGNNGGDGFVIARHLHNRNWDVAVVLAGDPQRLTPDAGANYAVVEAMGLPLTLAEDGESQIAAVQQVRRDHVVIDALLGTGFSGEVRSPAAELIAEINRRPHRATVAVDVPSGLDCDTGTPTNATVKADLTITFAAQKAGFVLPAAAPYVGIVEVADIGVPRAVIEEAKQASP